MIVSAVKIVCENSNGGMGCASAVSCGLRTLPHKQDLCFGNLDGRVFASYRLGCAGPNLDLIKP